MANAYLTTWLVLAHIGMGMLAWWFFLWSGRKMVGSPCPQALAAGVLLFMIVFGPVSVVGTFASFLMCNGFALAENESDPGP